MKNKIKKTIGILLSVLMGITMIPSMAFAASMPFTDVPSSEWYCNDVQKAFETGLINGFEDNTFRPDENMTYAQAVKLAACMNQKYTTGKVTLTNGSPDWWSSYAAYAREKGIIDREYDWDSFATRAGYVEIFAKALPDEALKEKNHIVDGYIPDVGISHPQAPAIYKLYRAGILTGMDEIGSFEAKSNIRRSEISAILNRMMNENARKELTMGPEIKQVVFISNGGSQVPAQQVVQYGKVVKPADPVRPGYRFAGWYIDKERETVFDFNSPVSEDLTLYARWEKKNIIQRQDGERFEDVMIIEGMEETVKLQHVRNGEVGYEIDFDYENFERIRELNGDRFVSRYDDPKKPENYLDVTSSGKDAAAVTASVSETLSKEYDISIESYTLERAGSCTRIDASVIKGTNQMASQLQDVYIIPAGDGCIVATAHYAIEEAEGFSHRFAYFMNTLSVISSQGERRISNEQALVAIEKYCYMTIPNLKDIVDSGKYMVSWGVISTDESEIVVLFRSYTGAEKRYYIDPVSGDTNVTEFVPGVTDEETPTDESLNAWDYLI